MGKRELVALLNLSSWCLWRLSGSSSWCHGVVCSLWLWYFLIILTYYFSIYVSWSTSELRVRLAPWNWFKPSSNIFLLTVPRRYFFCGTFVFFCALCSSWFRVCSLLPCSHLLGKGWLLGSCWWCLYFFVTFPCGILGQMCTWLYRFLIFAVFLTTCIYSRPNLA